MDAALPVQEHPGPRDEGPLRRPRRHARAAYLELEALAPEPRGVLAIKGTEVLAADLEARAEALAGRWNLFEFTLGGFSRNQWAQDFMLVNGLERFPLAEGKVPLALSLEEALGEAEAAARLQEAHRARFGTWAHAPLPLRVHAWPEAVGARLLEVLLPRLPEKLRRVTRGLVEGGLASYVYHYPCLPLRVSHLRAPDLGRDTGFAERLEALAEACDPAACVEGWLEVTARLFALGFVATDPAGACRGYALEPQNLVLDGGVVDLGSLRRLVLSRTQAGDLTARALTHVRGLQRLAMSRTAITDSGVQALTQLPNLRSLDLSETQVGDAGARALAGMRNLEELNLRGCRELTRWGADELRRADIRELTLPSGI